MPSYKLYYFDVPARGELPRILFAAAGQAFEDIRITRETWPEFKPKMPFGQVPVLDVDGTMIAQEYAISKFLATEFGFCSGSALDLAKQDMYVFASEDIYVQVEDIFHNFSNQEKRAELTKKWVEQTGPKILSILNEHLASSKSGFYVGDQMTYADIAMFANLGVMQHVVPAESVTLLAAYPNVKRHLDLVRSQKNIDAYVTKRDAAATK